MRKKLANLHMYFVTEIEQRGGNHYGREQELGVKGTGSRMLRHLPCPLPLSLVKKIKNKWHSL